MSILTQQLEVVRNRIISNQDLEIVRDQVRPAAEIMNLRQMEILLKAELPENLNDLLYGDVSGIAFSWRAKRELFGEECTRGNLILLTPEGILSQLNAQIAQVNEALSSQSRTRDGYAEIINDWPHWFPLFRFPSGDALCLETRKSDYPIVLLEHDVMDAGPNLHGMQIAPNLETLLRDWSAILFCEPKDWTNVCNAEGIDLNKPSLNMISKSGA